ncbi:MAG: siderophore-iron reductase FhuF [Enterobacterales bacterium endosymbiont of Blomia tropicalis]|uniref:siderophore-iron reductase FhuF n=1 Tax=Mixta mediterraneensis TaxID=2758443 RepID=UPI0025A76741|nr:siderophore-iron reductase FhuF [Mixta mediterraneensis]MDL4915474.1 siderophore-iron reductase FhuF [Mixta mediterraneensis]
MAIVPQHKHHFGNESLIFMQNQQPLADALYEMLQTQRSDMLEIIKFGQPARPTMTFSEWSVADAFTALTQRYSDHLYRNHPDAIREAKPVQSLWAQWYFGLLLPPLMMALLLGARAPDCAPQHIQVEFHENGHPCAFWLNAQEDEDARYLNAHQRIDRLIQQHLIPVVNGIAQHGDINARLIWNNMGFSFSWFLGELKNQLEETVILQLEQALFFTSHLLDGSDNPLYRTMLPRNGQMVRRSCCQRYRIPDVEQCGNCTLNPA